jgi:hypothetical protein
MDSERGTKIVDIGATNGVQRRAFGPGGIIGARETRHWHSDWLHHLVKLYYLMTLFKLKIFVRMRRRIGV